MQKDSIGIAKQSAFGTKQTTMEYFYDVESATVSGNPAQIENTTTVGYSFPIALDMGEQKFGLGLNVIPRAASFPRLLSSFFGAPVTTTVDTTAKKHFFDTVAQSALLYHTVKINRVDPATAITDLCFDGAGDTLVVSGKSGDFIKATANLTCGQNDNTQAVGSVTLDATERFKWYQAQLFANINGGGENAVKINSFEWTYQNNLEDDHFVMGSQTLAALPRSIPTSQLKFTMTEEDATTFLTWYKRALAVTSRDSIIFRLQVQGSLAGSTNVFTGFEIKGWNGEIIDAPANVDSKSRLRSIDLTARFDYDSTDTKFVDFTCYNHVTSY